jgi:hypothetical protein
MHNTTVDKDADLHDTRDEAELIESSKATGSENEVNGATSREVLFAHIRARF